MNDLERRVADLERRVPGARSALGTPGTSTAFGAAAGVYRDRFPAELTSAYDPSTGYSWERVVLDRTASSPEVVAVTDPQSGSYAFTPDNDQGLAAGTRGWLEADPNAGGWLFLTGGSGGASCDSDACDELVGLKEADCVKLSIVCHEGEFSGMDEEQFEAVFGWYEEYDTGLFGWVFYVWDTVTEDWVEFDMDWIGGSGGVVLTFAADGTPQLTVDDTLEMFYKPCAAGAKFVGGQRNGFTGDTPPEGCAPNVFVLKVECSCCSIDAFQGDGWYCVQDTGPSDCYAVELLQEEGDHCADADEPFVICSGPYATQELAEAACPPAPPPITTGCCPDDPVPQTLSAVVTSGGTYDGTYALTYRSGVWSFILDDGAIGTCGAGGTEAILALQCNGSNQWEFYTDDFVFGPFTPTSEACDPFSVVFDNVNFSLCGVQSGATVTVTA